MEFKPPKFCVSIVTKRFCSASSHPDSRPLSVDYLPGIAADVEDPGEFMGKPLYAWAETTDTSCTLTVGPYSIRLSAPGWFEHTGTVTSDNFLDIPHVVDISFPHFDDRNNLRLGTAKADKLVVQVLECVDDFFRAALCLKNGTAVTQGVENENHSNGTPR